MKKKKMKVQTQQKQYFIFTKPVALGIDNFRLNKFIDFN